MTELDGKLKQVRQKFLVKYNGSILDGGYDSRDVEWVKSNDAILRCSLNAFRTGGDVDKAVDLLNTILLFRAKYKLNDIKETDLDPELRALNCIFFQGKDKKGHKILYFNVSTQKKGYKVEEAKLYIAFYFNQHYMASPDEPMVILADLSSASINNLELELSKHIIECNGIYFPCITDYTLMFKMPFVLEAIWTIIKGWFDSDQNKKTHMVTRKNIQQFIDEDQLLPHMTYEEEKK